MLSVFQLHIIVNYVLFLSLNKICTKKAEKLQNSCITNTFV